MARVNRIVEGDKQEYIVLVLHIDCSVHVALEAVYVWLALYPLLFYIPLAMFSLKTL